MHITTANGRGRVLYGGGGCLALETNGYLDDDNDKI